MAVIGVMSGHIGISIVETITITISMEGTGGHGEDTGALAFICIASVPCIGTIKATGVGYALTGTCGVRTTTTSAHDGSGPQLTAVSVVTSTA
jgi:hypothetical protein